MTMRRSLLAALTLLPLGAHSAAADGQCRVLDVDYLPAAGNNADPTLNMPLSIGYGQTISQPYTVGFQTQLLQVKKGDKVLEIGTGSGYQTAVLCALGAKVFSIERHRPLHLATKQRLEKLGYRANLIFGDGYKGAPTHAPFDRIIVTCGAPEVPPGLPGQLKVGGIMVIPVGSDGKQIMCTWTRTASDSFDRQEHGAFSFVPMLAHKAAG